MAMHSLILWIYEEDRTIGYVGRMSGIDGRRVVDLVAGIAPTGDEVTALSQLTGISADDLTGPGGAAEWAPADPLHCYTIAEAAKLLGVSVDVVRAEIRSGALAHVVFGSRAYRIPRSALEERLARPGRGGEARRS